MKIIASLCLCAALGLAQAQTVWRCGPDGRSYADAPCPGGREVAVADARSAEQQHAARQVADRQARLARSMEIERERRQREAAASGRLAARIGPPDGELKPKAKARRHPAPAQCRRPAADGTCPTAGTGSRRRTG